MYWARMGTLGAANAVAGRVSTVLDHDRRVLG
jgi:hypothetical protein